MSSMEANERSMMEKMAASRKRAGDPWPVIAVALYQEIGHYKLAISYISEILARSNVCSYDAREIRAKLKEAGVYKGHVNSKPKKAKKKKQHPPRERPLEYTEQAWQLIKRSNEHLQHTRLV